MFSFINKTFGCCSKFFSSSNKKNVLVPDFVAVTKPFFSVQLQGNSKLHKKKLPLSFPESFKNSQNYP